jgi:polyisoprenoid-binding protein YceI
MQSPSGQAGAPELQALLRNGRLAGEWALDPELSGIRLRSKVIGVIPVGGEFREITGNGVVSGGGTVSGSVTVIAASIDTKNARRDRHLRSADFFDSDDNPRITFAADSIQPSARGVTVAGQLTVRGSARPLAFDAAAQIRGDDEVRLDAEVLVNRGDFGITWNPLGLMSMTTTLTVHAVFTRS